MYISSSLWTVSKCTLTGSAPTYGFHKLRVGPGTCIFNHISNWFLSLRIGGKSSEGNVVSLSEAGVNGLTQICFQKHSGCYWREGWELGEWRQSGRHAVIHMNHEETDNDGRDGGEAKNFMWFLSWVQWPPYQVSIRAFTHFLDREPYTQNSLWVAGGDRSLCDISSNCCKKQLHGSFWEDAGSRSWGWRSPQALWFQIHKPPKGPQTDKSHVWLQIFCKVHSQLPIGIVWTT